jgi:hypothetical protein
MCVETVREAQLSVILSATCNQYAHNPHSRALLSSCPPSSSRHRPKKETLSLGLFSAKPSRNYFCAPYLYWICPVLESQINNTDNDSNPLDSSRISSYPSGHCDPASTFLPQDGFPSHRSPWPYLALERAHVPMREERSPSLASGLQSFR